MNKHDIRYVVRTTSEFLGINKPAIKFDFNGFNTSTQMAKLDVQDNAITVNANIKDDKDVIFAIAHEIRHIWQHENDFMNFDEHKCNGSISVEDYNMQQEEIDANAFAVCVVVELFGSVPLFQSLSEDVKKSIFERAKVIAKDLHVQ